MASDFSRTTAAPSAAADADGGERRRPPGPRLGELPLARRDMERLQQILTLQRRLRDPGASPRAMQALTHRNIFGEALTWLDIHGGAAAAVNVERWKSVLEERDPAEPAPGLSDEPPPRRRRRRRRRRDRPAPS